MKHFPPNGSIYSIFFSTIFLETFSVRNANIFFPVFSTNIFLRPNFHSIVQELKSVENITFPNSLLCAALQLSRTILSSQPAISSSSLSSSLMLREARQVIRSHSAVSLFPLNTSYTGPSLVSSSAALL